ncbi:glycosyltransferase family 2 protein [Donghicola sp. C2-DW-16]|uniref:Glycosyltransferase family 2 protein n=1 Tax=Donghicola mangrovi TaxID=2729614 RepID=A0ABX2PI02_9RHOB|nr:glycosyltransferase family A protein [Donghicola mangrovi]NVO29140.1 glycosyltransferase family 2 protein [Donghicola mangrovi]
MVFISRIASRKTKDVIKGNLSLIMDAPQYGAVIRAYQYTDILEEVVKTLRAQTVPPKEIIFVDSSRNAETTAKFAALGVTIVPYSDEEFNYSRAINLGVAANPEPLTLIISSHVLLGAGLVERGWRDAQAHGLEIVFWSQPTSGKLGESGYIVDLKNFDGTNGIGNSASLIPTSRIVERPFREEVFSAEDQEWSKYYYKTFRRGSWCVETNEMQYLNPNHGKSVWSWEKLLNEELSIGYFVNRRLIMPDRIAIRVLRGVLATVRRRPERARMHFCIATAFFMANFRRPKAKSRYF